MTDVLDNSLINDPSGDLTKRNPTIRPREAYTAVPCRHKRSGKRFIVQFIACKNELNASPHKNELNVVITTNPRLDKSAAGLCSPLCRIVRPDGIPCCATVNGGILISTRFLLLPTIGMSDSISPKMGQATESLKEVQLLVFLLLYRYHGVDHLLLFYSFKMIHSCQELSEYPTNKDPHAVIRSFPMLCPLPVSQSSRSQCIDITGLPSKSHQPTYSQLGEREDGDMSKRVHPCNASEVTPS
jgi:hypothetical protein